MENTNKRTSPGPVFVLGNLILFFVAHMTFLASDSEGLATVFYYLFKVYTIIFPPLAAIFTLSGRYARGTSQLFLSPLVFSLTKLLYYLPYYYELYVLEENMVSIDALLTSAIFSLADVALSYVQILIYALITLLILRLFARDVSGEEGNTVSPYDLSHPTVIMSLVPSLLGLIYHLALEIIDAASFMKIYASTVNTGELFTMVTNPILIITIHVIIFSLSVKRSFPTLYADRERAVAEDAQEENEEEN